MADYLAKVAEQKEADRAERARLREEEIAQREFEREKERLLKEHAHYSEAAEQLRANGDHTKADEAEAKLVEINEAIDGVNERPPTSGPPTSGPATSTSSRMSVPSDPR